MLSSKIRLKEPCHGIKFFFNKLHLAASLTLPETNSSPLETGLNAPKGNEKVFQPSIFGCELLMAEIPNNHLGWD